jgi:hypothetical protein
MLMTFLFTYLTLFGLGEFVICHSNTRVGLMFSSPNACLTIARVSIALFSKFAQNLIHTRYRIHSKIANKRRLPPT